MFNTRCYHGIRLPDGGQDVKPFWNGKGYSLELAHVKSLNDGTLRPIARCRWCGHMWRYTWDEILRYVPDLILRNRLEEYAKVGQTTTASAVTAA